MEAFAALREGRYAINSHRIREAMDSLALADRDSTSMDRLVRSYYLNHGDFIWIDRHGVDGRADTLLAWLRTVGSMGFSTRKFCVEAIDADLRRVRQLDLDDGSYTVNRVLARLEYRLTKAYMRYAAGQRYGYTNPWRLFNRLDTVAGDSTHTSFRTLFDVPMETRGRSFFSYAAHMASADSIALFLRSVQPRSALYERLLRELQTGGHGVSRPQLLCNLERARWRVADRPEREEKYVLVNIPAFRLYARDGGEALTMRVGCGTFDTKTPLLASRIKRMDLNPQWILPRSIIKKSVVEHAGDEEYFARHHYFVRERRTGRRMDIASVTPEMLLSRDYLVIQEGGEGNSLGRIIFRFDNKFSIYLHDTSSRGVFSRDDRGVSHGCVRVERPYDLAVFLLGEADDDLAAKIKYTMTADVSGLGTGRTEDGEAEQRKDTLNRKMLLRSLNVTPAVPVFITYFTIYPDTDGTLREYPDVYGYDKVMYQELLNYTE